MSRTRAVVVGAGITGSLLAVFLARHGMEVELYERRPDLRDREAGGGRAINLTVSRRGLAVLDRVGLSDAVLAVAAPVRRRAVHLADGSLRHHPYGRRAGETLWSVDRNDVNRVLLEHADGEPGVRLHFRHRFVSLDAERPACTFALADGGETSATGDLVVGADGAFSDLRDALHRNVRGDLDRRYLDWGYREVEIAPAADGAPRLEADCLHLWPRGDAMFLALPKTDGSFNCIAVLPFDAGGDLAGADDAAALFGRRFPDLLALQPDLPRQLAAGPTSNFVMQKTWPWAYRDRVVLVGDAAHTTYPFYGQGMISGFEDCAVLAEELERCGDGGRAEALDAYQRRRKPDTDALAGLSEDNFRQLSDRARSWRTWLSRRCEDLLSRLFPHSYLPLYSMVAHTSIPYREAVERARRRNRVAGGVGLAALALLCLPLLSGLKSEG